MSATCVILNFLVVTIKSKINFLNVCFLTIYAPSIIISTHNQDKNFINEIFYILFILSFGNLAHLGLDQPRFKFLIVTHGKWVPYWTVQVFLTLSLEVKKYDQQIKVAQDI